MFYHYLLIAWRNLKRKKTLSMIQVLCLAVGLAAFFLVARYVQYEKNFDKFNTNYKTIYRAQAYKQNDRTDDWFQIPVPVAEYLEQNIPEVEKALVFREIWYEYLSPDNQRVFKEQKGCWAPSDIFEMFSFQLLQGDRETLLDIPNAIVLSQSMAERYFPGENAFGKTIYDGQKNKLQVTGIMKDIPEQSHMQVDYFRSNSTTLKNYGENWFNYSFKVYVQTKSNVAYASLSKKIEDILIQHDPTMGRKLYLNPLSNLHLKENARDDRGVVIYLFSIIGLLILLLACVSFMNLTTAFSSLRQVEIGVRKSIGSSKRNIVVQFLSESVAISFIAFILAVFIAYLLLPIFNSMVERNIELNLFNDYRFTLFLLAVVFLTGLLAGAYPAFVVSNYRPIVVLKRINVVKKKQFSGLEAMVYFQFLLSVVLITISLWGYRQVNYLTNKDLGFEKEHLLHCSLPKQNSTVSYKSLRNEILAYPGIENMGISINSPMHSSWGCQVTPEGWSSENSVLSRWNAACSNYLSTMNLTLLEGRNLSDDRTNDKQACLINETAARAFGWEKPIGKKLERDGVYTVVGVIKDFNIEDVHNPIIPYVLFLNEQDLSKANDLTFKIHPEDMSGSLAHIHKVLDKHFKDVLFEVNGYDANLQRLEIKIWNSANNTIIFFTIMAVIIAAMGLFGLIYYSAQRRTKEIGVRKVQGAKVRQILPLIIKKYLIMAIVVNVIVYPVADFLKYTLPGQYKYQFTLVDVVLILLMSILITLISSGFQAYKASVLNPVKALRYE